MKYSFIELAYDVLKESNKPLSINEMWTYATETGKVEKLSSSGKTPIKTLAARIYLDIRDNESTKIMQVSKRPAKFFIKDTSLNEHEIKAAIEKVDKKIKTKYVERDLHTLLSSFVHANSHFKCLTKTIYHEKSSKAVKGKNEWLHPDLVGIYYPFGDFKAETLKLLSVVKENPYKLFSFEIKKEINFTNLRECFFQAVSNSSWAHEGYLVTLKMEEDPGFYEELRRLNNSFGIGVIKLDAENISQSVIVFQSSERNTLDWDTIDRLSADNVDFNEFIADISLDASDNDRRLRGKYDFHFIEDEDATKYAKDKGMI